MSDTPAWLNSLVEVVADATTSQGVPGPLGFRYSEEDGFWDVLVYPLPVELVGGAHDGGVVSPCFSLDLEEVRAAFTRVDDVAWNAHAAGPEDEALTYPSRASTTGVRSGSASWPSHPTTRSPG